MSQHLKISCSKISIASHNGGVSGHFCMIWGRRNTVVKRLPMTRTNNLRSHSRSKYRAMTIPGLRDNGQGVTGSGEGGAWRVGKGLGFILFLCRIVGLVMRAKWISIPATSDVTETSIMIQTNVLVRNEKVILTWNTISCVPLLCWDASCWQCRGSNSSCLHQVH